MYHYLSLSAINCQYFAITTKVMRKQATDGVAVKKKTFPKAIENQDLNDYQ